MAEMPTMENPADAVAALASAAGAFVTDQSSQRLHEIRATRDSKRWEQTSMRDALSYGPETGIRMTTRSSVPTVLVM